MVVQVATLAGGVLAGLAVIAVIYVLGMRTKSSLVLSPLIRLQRAFINPRQLKAAGAPGAYAGVICHRGRSTGRSYETPVGVVADGDRFLIALVYGSRTQWLRNVLASGSATLVHEGQTFPVDQPEVVPMRTVVDRFPAGDRRGFRVLGVDQVLRVRRAEPEAQAPAGTSAR